MIRFSAAILAFTVEQFSKDLLKLMSANITSIDIDITEQSFAGSKTVSFADIANIVRDYPEIDFGFHLMQQYPKFTLRAIIEFCEVNQLPLPRVYVHQESVIDRYILDQAVNLHLGVAVNLATPLKGLDFYQQFAEVQIMTVEIGKQGGEFSQVTLAKVQELVDMGYTGVISVDGGINNKTITKVKELPIERVSIGSYLVNATDVSEALTALK